VASGAAWDDPPLEGSVKYFLDRMEDHTHVTRVETLSANRYDLTLKDGTDIRVFITPTYTFDLSDYEQLRARHPEVNCILSDSSWNYFSGEAERVARADGIATFHLGRDLMGALNYRGDAFLDYSA